jgi:phage terminase small subunit
MQTMAPKPTRAEAFGRRFERFLEAYERTGNAYRAALWAGYSDRMAHSKSYLLAKRARVLAERPRNPT